MQIQDIQRRKEGVWRLDRRYDVETILSQIHKDCKSIVVEGVKYPVSRKSLRTLRVFNEKGTKCASCGVEGTFFVKRRSGGSNIHFRLAGIDRRGKMVLFTKDHIIPKSKGGGNVIGNFQTMCELCNHRKDDKIPKDIVAQYVNGYVKVKRSKLVCRRCSSLGRINGRTPGKSGTWFVWMECSNCRYNWSIGFKRDSDRVVAL